MRPVLVVAGSAELGRQAARSMLLDDFSIGMICVSFILAPIAVLVVGSQEKADARFIADCSISIFLVLLLISCTRFVAGRSEDRSGGLGLVVLFSALIAAVGLGCRIASSRSPTPQSGKREDEGKPSPWDDELA